MGKTLGEQGAILNQAPKGEVTRALPPPLSLTLSPSIFLYICSSQTQQCLESELSWDLNALHMGSYHNQNLNRVQFQV